MERKVTTVTTVLYNGNYDGPQMSISDISGCQMFVIARDDLNFISSHDEMKKPAFYVLIGSKKGLSGQLKRFFIGYFQSQKPLHTGENGKNSIFNRTDTLS